MGSGPIPRVNVSDSKASVPSAVFSSRLRCAHHGDSSYLSTKSNGVLEVRGRSWAGRSWSRREVGAVSAASPEVRGSAPGWRGFPGVRDTPRKGQKAKHLQESCKSFEDGISHPDRDWPGTGRGWSVTVPFPAAPL